jgi:hypothetical protein
LQYVAPKCALDIVKINLRKVLAQDLLGRIVDEDVQLSELLHVLVDGALASFIIHEVAGNEVALLAFLSDEFPRFLGVLLFLGEVDDCYIGSFPCEEDSDRSANSGATILVSLRSLDRNNN